MTQTMLERIFQEKPISAKREQCRPSAVFEQNLDDWVRRRGNDLYSKPHGYYDYLMPDLLRKLDATSGIFKRSEQARADIRDGADPDEFMTDADNAPPGRYMEMTATWFGWRLIPLARKFAEESEQQDFAFHVEKSIRTWLARADVVWKHWRPCRTAARTASRSRCGCNLSVRTRTASPTHHLSGSIGTRNRLPPGAIRIAWRIFQWFALSFLRALL